MTSNDKNVKPERVYNKDRIQRIKEAAEQSRKNDPNWFNNAPESYVSDGENDRPITRSRTPNFLKESSSDGNTNDIVSKKLTINELTKCTKDSSQLAVIMGSEKSKGQVKEPIETPVNHLEQSRRNKMMEREEANRKIAESLDMASAKWHTHMKGMDQQILTHDSSGVKKSLFNDDPNSIEKFENENTEKSKSNQRFSTDFADRLDMILQRGLRNPWLSKSMMNIRSLNERSHNRWTSRLDRFSSVWDLKYSLLHNHTKTNTNMNHFTPLINPNLTSNSNLSLQTSNHYSTYSSPDIPQPLINSPFNLQRPFPSNTTYPLNTLPQYQMNLSHSSNQFSSRADPNTFPNNPWAPHNITPFNPCQPPQPATNLQQGYHSLYCNNSHMPSTAYPTNYGPLNQGPFQFCSPNADHYGSNDDPTKTFISDSLETVSQRMNDLVEKVDKLNSAVDQLSLKEQRKQVKPIIKNNQSAFRESNSGRSSSERGILNKTTSVQRTCTCGNCNIKGSIYNIAPTDRRVTFATPSKFKEVESTSSIQDFKEVTSREEDLSKVPCSPEETETGQYYRVANSVHPHVVTRKHDEKYSKSHDLKTFKLPDQVASMLMSRPTKHSRRYFRGEK